MIVGLTATRYGMTRKQQDELRDVLRWLYRGGMRFEVHHGCCIGGDTEGHHIVRELFGKDATIHGWPAKNVGAQSTVLALGRDLDVIHAPMPPLERNVEIVTVSKVLIAAPRERQEMQRSGTWTTIRNARNRGRLTVMLYP